MFSTCLKHTQFILLLLEIWTLAACLSACDFTAFKTTEVVLTKIVVIPRGEAPPDSAYMSATPDPIALGSTATIEPSPSDTSTVVESSAQNSTPTKTPTKRMTPKSTATADGCPGAPPQQVGIGDKAYVCTKSDHVVLREKPNRSADMLRYLAPGKTLTVIGGPSCANSWSWWNVRTEDDVVGWIAEGGDRVDPYFICPRP